MKSPNERLRIVVLGYIVRGPLGGLAWHHLQYVLGLQELGHEVAFIEDSDDYPSCYDPSRHVMDTDATYGLRFAADVFDRTTSGDCWAYYDGHHDNWCGPLRDRAVEFCSSADVCFNVSGVNPLRPWLESIPHRIFIDTDPVFTQVRHLTNEKARALAAGHTEFRTFAENIGRLGCTVPDDGFAWQPTRQPLVARVWPIVEAKKTGNLTTVMQWDSYPAVQFAGRRYGLKSDSFRPYFDLPTRVECTLELALGSEHAPHEELIEHGWRLSDPLKITRTPWTYQDFIAKSLGEFGVAKHGYVVSGSGWFSERSLGYLASGRPVIAQDTGFSEWLPTDCGILSFTSLEEAVDAIKSVMSDHRRHREAAREVAVEYFSASKVLSDLITSTVS